MTLPINWVYSPEDCDFLFYSRWIDEQNLEETSQALKEGNIPCTSEYCPLKLEKGWQVVPQLFPGFTLNEIKGDCIIERVNFWDSTAQVYAIGDEDAASFLENIMNIKIEIEDYFKPVLMKVGDACTMGFEAGIDPLQNFTCENVLNNGPSDSKVDIVFISDRYTDINSWTQDVDSMLDFEGIQEGLFSVEPMKSNKEKFNVWRIDKLDNEFYDFEFHGYNGPAIVEMAEEICEDIDLTMVILDNANYPNFEGGIGGNSLAMVARYRMGELSTRAMVHEFGHAFVNLGDEYENDLQAADYTERPNIDSEGCPKWCSGELNEEADCYDEYLEFRTCLYNATNNLTEEYSEECNYNNILTNCNLGKDCQEGTGCYFNAKSVIAFRSSERSIMKYPSEDPFEFNTISKEAILNKINSLSE